MPDGRQENSTLKTGESAPSTVPAGTRVMLQKSPEARSDWMYIDLAEPREGLTPL